MEVIPSHCAAVWRSGMGRTEIEFRCANIRRQLDWMKKNCRWVDYFETLGSLRMLIRMSDDPEPYEAILKEYE